MHQDSDSPGSGSLARTAVLAVVVSGVGEARVLEFDLLGGAGGAHAIRGVQGKGLTVKKPANLRKEEE